ncbi:MAG: (2Fe-2S) ferredoxin domain-containing protein, partial [Clostridia bacterium]|nr:(2Fe-2S) ferredoxin domain-containing protein [Clostridia bacterium]
MKLVIGKGSCGIAAGAAKIHTTLLSLLENTDIAVGIAGCIGMCFLEPIVDVYEHGILLRRLVRVSQDDCERIAKAVTTNDLS